MDLRLGPIPSFGADVGRNVSVPVEVLEWFVGEYEMSPGMTITVRRVATH